MEWTTGRLLALIRRFTGNLASLTTPVKTDLVSAVNSLNPQFSSTPVYDVTLAEAMPADNTTPYTINAEQLGGEYRELYIKIFVPAGTESLNARIAIGYLNGSEKRGYISSLRATSDKYATVYVLNLRGIAAVWASCGTQHNNASVMDLARAVANDPVFISKTSIASISINFAASIADLPAGTRITIYAAS